MQKGRKDGNFSQDLGKHLWASQSTASTGFTIGSSLTFQRRCPAFGVPLAQRFFVSQQRSAGLPLPYRHA